MAPRPPPRPPPPPPPPRAPGAGGPSDRYRARRDRARPVYCLRHGMEGCAHAPACRVLEVKQDIDAIKAVMEGLR